jgi:hypothetical protein
MTSAGRPSAPRSVRSAADWLGPVGTLAMDLLLYARYRRGGGKQHLVRLGVLRRPVQLGRGASARASLGKRLFEGLFQKKLPPRRAELVSNITNWAYGMLNGALYGIAAESLGQPCTWYGLPFGAGVSAVDYAVLPAAGLYKPIQDYDRQTLAKDLTAHLVYGTTTTGALRLLSPLTKHPRHGRVRGASTGVSFRTADSSVDHPAKPALTRQLVIFWRRARVRRHP